MRETRPQVFLIARPALDHDGLRGYLEAVGGAAWLDGRDGANPAETLVEFAGRACYRSWAPGLNPNVTRVREDQREYLDNILASGHGSVLEHASFTFAFRDVSRVFTHELVRHRAGSAWSRCARRWCRSSSSWRSSSATRRPHWASTTTASRSRSRRRRPRRCGASRRSG
jgi:thymidylate synthase (FAD)